MLKKWMLGLTLLVASLGSQAAIIDQTVQSVEMEGITVTAFFAGGTQETQVWSALSSTLGGVDNGAWSLKLDGDTFGEYDDINDNILGLWTLENISVTDGIVGLSIDAGIAGFYFDILFGDVNSTPGSGTGRDFVSNDDTVTALFDDLFMAPDLYGMLNINWAANSSLAAGESFLFLTDTDKMSVSAPTTILTFALGLVALARLRKKSSGR